MFEGIYITGVTVFGAIFGSVYIFLLINTLYCFFYNYINDAGCQSCKEPVDKNIFEFDILDGEEVILIGVIIRGVVAIGMSGLWFIAVPAVIAAALAKCARHYVRFSKEFKGHIKNKEAHK